MDWKKISIIIMISLSLFVSTGIASEKNMKIVCDVWPPYQISNEGSLNGFSTKIIKEVLKRMNVDIESLEACPWKRALYLIEKDEADALFSANYTQERTGFAYYPDEAIVESPWVIWSRAEDAFTYASLNDLIGKKLGTVRGYSYTQELMDFLKTHNNYDEVTDDLSNFKKLNAGRVDVIIAELGNGYSVLNELKIKNIVPHKNHPIKTDGLYIIFNKHRISQAFVKKFSEELKKIKQESIYQTWYDDYFKST